MQGKEKRPKSTIRLILTAIAIIVALSIGAISFAAWSGGGSSVVSTSGTTGQIDVVGDLTVTPINGTGKVDETDAIRMEKLYPVDYLGNGYTYWAFEVKAAAISNRYAVLSIKGELNGNGGSPLSAVSGELYWTTDGVVTQTPLDAKGTKIRSGLSYISVTDNAVDTVIYVYMQAYKIDAMSSAAAITFNIEYAELNTEKNYESIKVYAPDSDGLPVRLRDLSGSVVGGEKEVANGVAEFNNIHGDIYTVEDKGFNAWGSFGEPLYVIGNGYDITVEPTNTDILLGKKSWTSRAGEVVTGAWTELFLDGVCLGDGWFATKVSDLTDVIGAGSEIRFGFRIGYDVSDNGDAEVIRDFTILKQKGVWMFQTVDVWMGFDLPTEFHNWMKDGTPFYFGVNRTKATGTLDVYMGTGFDDLIKVGSVYDVAKNKDIVKFGIIKWRDLGAYDLTLSNTRYGETAKEAFGAVDLDLSDTNVNVTMQTVPPENAGIITVDSAIKSGKVEITLTPKDGYALTELQVNGKNKHANYVAEPMTVTVSDCYLMNDIKIDAEFSKTVTPIVTFGTEASGLNVKLVRNGVEIVKGQNVVEQDGKTILDGQKIEQDGKVVFPALAVGQYDVWVYAFGVWGNSGKTVSFTSETTEYSVTLDNTTELLNGKLDEYKDVTLSGLELQDGWFVTKVSGLCESTSEIRFGFRIDYDGVGRRDFTILKQKKENSDEWKPWMFQTLESWHGFILPAEFDSWLNDGTPFYFAVHRKKIDGKLEVFMGASLTELKQVGTVTDYSGAGKNIVRLGVIKYSGTYDCTLSDIKYGTTPKDAFGADTNIVIDEHGDVKEIK